MENQVAEGKVDPSKRKEVKVTDLVKFVIDAFWRNWLLVKA